jgi:biotin synthase
MISRDELLSWLHEDREDRLEELWAETDRVRRHHVGPEVHLRGLLEISNRCIRRCGYCGLNIGNKKVTRYRMPHDEVLQCAGEAASYGYGTVVLQAGEDPGLDAESIASLVQDIKKNYDLAVTLSLGERSNDELKLWREAGADRYLLRFETSNEKLFHEVHPPLPSKDGEPHRSRIDMLRSLREIGFEIGSGVMIGLPGQTYDDLANDILLFNDLDLDMIGVGPFISHPTSQLGRELEDGEQSDSSLEENSKQVPSEELMVYKTMALTRIVCPESNIPSTSALATLNLETGRELGLSRGANVVMPNLTPAEYRIHYEIYPNKACIRETAEKCHHCMGGRIRSIGRVPGVGHGGRLRGDSPQQRRNQDSNDNNLPLL